MTLEFLMTIKAKIFICKISLNARCISQVFMMADCTNGIIVDYKEHRGGNLPAYICSGLKSVHIGHSIDGCYWASYINWSDFCLLVQKKIVVYVK